MAFQSSHGITNLGAPEPSMVGNIWSPAEFRALQMRDYLDFRAIGRSGSVTSVLRLLANREVHVYGEFVMHDGGVRSLETIGLTCVDGSKDVASFRTGGSEGDEVVRVGKDAQLTGLAGTGVGADARWTLMARTPGALTPGKMALKTTELRFEVQNGTSTRWGRMLYSNAGERVLDTHGGGSYNLLVIQCDNLHLRDAGGMDNAKFLAGGTLRMIAPTSSDKATLELDSTAAASAKKWQVVSDNGSPYSLLFKEASTGAKAAITVTGGIRLEGRAILLKDTTTPLNTWSDPVGTFILDDNSTGERRLWVRFASGSGGTSNDWWYVKMTRET